MKLRTALNPAKYFIWNKIKPLLVLTGLYRTTPHILVSQYSKETPEMPSIIKDILQNSPSWNVKPDIKYHGYITHFNYLSWASYWWSARRSKQRVFLSSLTHELDIIMPDEVGTYEYNGGYRMFVDQEDLLEWITTTCSGTVFFSIRCEGPMVSLAFEFTETLDAIAFKMVFYDFCKK